MTSITKNALLLNNGEYIVFPFAILYKNNVNNIQ